MEIAGSGLSAILGHGATENNEVKYDTRTTSVGVNGIQGGRLTPAFSAKLLKMYS